MSIKEVTHASHEHVDPLKSYLVVFGALMVLLFLTVGAYKYLKFDEWFGEQWGFLNTAIALIVATTKTSLVVLVFMHLRHGTRLTWVIASAGFLWLCIMITFFFADYLSRAQIPEIVHGSDPASRQMVTPQSTHRESAPFNGLG